MPGPRGCLDQNLSAEAGFGLRTARKTGVLESYRAVAQVFIALVAIKTVAVGLLCRHARPHQNLQGLTPAQRWNGWSKTDLLQTPPRKVLLVQALDGLLVGYCTRR